MRHTLRRVYAMRALSVVEAAVEVAAVARLGNRQFSKFHWFKQMSDMLLNCFVSTFYLFVCLVLIKKRRKETAIYKITGLNEYSIFVTI